MDFLKVKLSVKREAENLRSIVNGIYTRAGLPGFYIGLGPKLAKSGAQKFVYFYVYEALIQFHAQFTGGAQLGVLLNLCLALLADYLCVPVVVPLDFLTTQR